MLHCCAIRLEVVSESVSVMQFISEIPLSRPNLKKNIISKYYYFKLLSFLEIPDSRRKPRAPSILQKMKSTADMLHRSNRDSFFLKKNPFKRSNSAIHPMSTGSSGDFSQTFSKTSRQQICCFELL